jgi:hypothetical protein
MENSEQIGHVIDLTTEGILLLSDRPIPIDKQFHLKMDLPSDIKGTDLFEFRAVSLWSSKDENPDFINTGFKILEIEEEGLRVINRLIKRFRFRD